MAKTRMNNAHREVLRSFAYKKINEVVDRKGERKLYEKLLTKSSEAVRKKYPEDEMKILRKYKLVDDEQEFKVVFEDGRVDAMYFKEKQMPDRPYEDGYGRKRGDVFPMGKEYENTLAEFILQRDKNNEIIYDKKRDVDTLINFAKYVEDVLEVIKVPKDIEYQLVAKSTALVALSPDVIQRIQKDFMS